MSELQLLRIESGDSQKNLMDKVNSNFSQLINYGGGPYGRIGPKGPMGERGIPGPKGSFGDPGIRGTKWTIGPTQPGITGSLDNDWWLNTYISNSVYKYSSSGGWVPQGFNLNGFDLFSVQGPLSTLSGITNKYGYFFSSSTPLNYTFLMSDNPSIINGTETSPNPVPNPQYSKFVISVDGTNASKKILEFTKAPYSSNPSFDSKTPKFLWNQGATALRGNYGLQFVNGDKTTWQFVGNLNLRSDSGAFYIKSTRFNAFLNNQSSQFTVNSTGNIFLNFVGSTVTFSTKNLTYGSSGIFILPVQLNVSANPSTGVSPDPALKVTSTNSQTGNIRYLYNTSSNSNAQLFSVSQLGATVMRIFGNGNIFYDKRVNSIQEAQTITETTSNTVGATTVYWTTVVPSISVNIGTGNYYYANNGVDYIISKSPSASSGKRGICIWTPATGASSGYNKGWLNLLENGEAFTFRVHASDSAPRSQEFQYIGLNTSETMAQAPFGAASSNYSVVDLGVGATTVDFTIINITGTGATGGSRRWFRVYYSAWGGSLATPQSGILQTYNSTA